MRNSFTIVMKSFRTELENPVVAEDIVDLEKKIYRYKHGEMPEEKFRSLRLARGIYGQRQPGVQMVRIKLPFGKVSSKQLTRICEVSDTYSTGKMHITTRQDIQIHYVDLERTPELWADLEQDEVTIREACGNTVRNVTASETAGIDPDEPFDVSPYAEAVFSYFLRNPIAQEMGRKFKVAFSATEKDTGLAYLNDLGFIAKDRNGKRGFKVLLAGGLGAQPRKADILYDFLSTDKIIPLMETIIRVFDRYGERKSRAKARLKFLLKEIGLEKFKELLKEEENAIAHAAHPIDLTNYVETIPPKIVAPKADKKPDIGYEKWLKTNVIAQKQMGYSAIGVKVRLGDFYTQEVRLLAQLVEKYAAAEIRLTLRQNMLIPFVPVASLPYFYQELKKLGFAEIGYNKTVDTTACPGTDTCNLGIASSTGIAVALEEVLLKEYPQYTENQNIVIKISGCMNACGQHNMAHIGFQGMSIRTKDKLVAPALQVLLGGHNFGDGKARFADKVVKIPSKRGPQALRLILNDFEKYATGRSFIAYYEARGERYFYNLLKDLSDISRLESADFVDWGTSEKYKKEIGVGECAGVVIDLVATLFLESHEKLQNAETAYTQGKWGASIYYGYQAMIHAAKALLLTQKAKTNTHAGIITDFDRLFLDTQLISLEEGLTQMVQTMKNTTPDQTFAKYFLQASSGFVQKLEAHRILELKEV